jgi:erythrocyte band 7 integral membrane protein
LKRFRDKKFGRNLSETVIFFFLSHSTRLLAATTLRNVLGTKNLAEILSERESISHVMQSSLDDATDPWGVKVERVEM